MLSLGVQIGVRTTLNFRRGRSGVIGLWIGINRIVNRGIVISKTRWPEPLFLLTRLCLYSSGQGCTSYRSGKRQIKAQIMGINTKGKQDWRLLCKTTPLVWDMTTYTNPTECEERVSVLSFYTFRLSISDVNRSSGGRSLRCGKCPTKPVGFDPFLSRIHTHLLGLEKVLHSSMPTRVDASFQTIVPDLSVYIDVE